MPDQRTARRIRNEIERITKAAAAALKAERTKQHLAARFRPPIPPYHVRSNSRRIPVR